MTVKEKISQLKDLIKDRESLLEESDPDSVYAADIEALEWAVAELEGKEINTAPKLTGAYAAWEKKKSVKNFAALYQAGFTGGNPVWKFYRLVTGLLTGRYVKFYNKYRKGERT